MAQKLDDAEFSTELQMQLQAGWLNLALSIVKGPDQYKQPYSGLPDHIIHLQCGV